MDYKEELLAAILDCEADQLNFFERCRYNFSDVVMQCKENIDDISLNGLKLAILHIAIDEIDDAIEDKISEIEERLADGLTMEDSAMLSALQQLNPFENFHLLSDNTLMIDHEDFYSKHFKTPLDRLYLKTGFHRSGGESDSDVLEPSIRRERSDSGNGVVIAERICEYIADSSGKAKACYEKLINNFSQKAVEFVIAATIANNEYDGRYSGVNKKWAKKTLSVNEIYSDSVGEFSAPDSSLAPVINAIADICRNKSQKTFEKKKIRRSMKIFQEG